MKKALVVISEETEKIYEGLKVIAESTGKFEVTIDSERPKEWHRKYDVVIFSPYWKKDVEIAEVAAKTRIAIVPHHNGITDLDAFKLSFIVAKEYTYCRNCNGLASCAPHKVAVEIAREFLND